MPPSASSKKCPHETPNNQSTPSKSTHTSSQNDDYYQLLGNGLGEIKTVIEGSSSLSVPLYAVPDKLKQKVRICGCARHDVSHCGDILMIHVLPKYN